jgi:hypothetical protein
VRRGGGGIGGIRWTQSPVATNQLLGHADGIQRPVSGVCLQSLASLRGQIDSGELPDWLWLQTKCRNSCLPRGHPMEAYKIFCSQVSTKIADLVAGAVKSSITQVRGGKAAVVSGIDWTKWIERNGISMIWEWGTPRGTTSLSQPAAATTRRKALRLPRKQSRVELTCQLSRLNTSFITARCLSAAPRTVRSAAVSP